MWIFRRQSYPHGHFALALVSLTIYLYLKGYWLFENINARSFYQTREKQERGKQDFLADWAEFIFAHLDVNRFKNGCNLKWTADSAVPWMHQVSRSDPNTSRVVLWDIRPSGDFSRLMVTTKYPNTTQKKIGGDYWRVNIRGTTAVPVMKNDLLNGSYEFKFLILEPGAYYVEIFLEYTQCKGVKEPPDSWFQKGCLLCYTREKRSMGFYHQDFACLSAATRYRGTVHGKDQPQGTLLFEAPFMNQRLLGEYRNGFDVLPSNSLNNDYSRYLQEACQKNVTSCNFLFRGLGRWINSTVWKPWCSNLESDHVHRRRQGALWLFGDSVSSQFYYSIKHHRLCQTIFRHCFYSYSWIYSIENYNLSYGDYVRHNLSVMRRARDRQGFNVLRVIEDLKQALLHPVMDNKSVIIFNYGLHFTESTTYAEFAALIDLIIAVRADPKVKAKMVWRTTTSLKRHKYSRPNLHSTRFMTSQRVQLYNAYATNAFCKAGFPVIDVYPLTDSYPGETGSIRSPTDHVHYEPHVLMHMADQLARVFS